ncbi:TAXI family TRAP transporter solute-binding subunit [Halomonas sp. McH1-25]|uniref:TAXI family TRAP transporter solute-binding subunit n=1 Tax=unclassified Halomonas TaxID=2609666 RepID=UPI001EF4A036|nr:MULTISPECIES: TAXI family TRAP transporter solute-binding subunit [unclassified Halomonas]MCG7599207.1 TAXI family TRAP transporter solute-binding subunit [Halomonas sp. McH1-25]MCP1341075.1 TAXI family TRAP transporter solute-binding subunit [Halomonas sp. FL8]MCP1361705.1 TAXI family TRAP transporter solute-binding subunit [Halomonas sp. BBD45]MCP1365219.1 TAXI family TRAP transporter solute-binding subunit [Halomonas sp. BBD48]
MKRHSLSAAVMLSGAMLGAATLSTPAMAQEQFLTIGTGGQTGVYYVVGQSMCRMVNRSEEQDIKCNAPSTGGSVANVNGIKSDELDMGVVQSDVAYRAYNGEGNFEQPFKELRSVFSMHGEPLTVLARADAGIDELEDLKGKRVNIGNPGSGQRATMEVLMDAKGWTNDVYSLASELTAAEQAAALADNNIDAMVYVVGHPNGSIQEATTTVDAKLVPLEGEAVDQLVEKYPYYSTVTIPGGLYKGNPDDVDTFGVMATVVTDENTDADVVYATVKSVFENFDRFKRLHPAFANLKPEEMISNGLTAPLHEGAARYYKEQGWIE